MNTSCLKLIEPAPAGRKGITFSAGSRGVFQVSMQHLRFFTYHCPQNAITYGLTAFCSSRLTTIFSPLQLLVIAVFWALSHPSNIAHFMASLCFKIVLIVHSASNKSKKTHKNIQRAISWDVNNMKLGVNWAAFSSFLSCSCISMKGLFNSWDIFSVNDLVKNPIV